MSDQGDIDLGKERLQAAVAGDRSALTQVLLRCHGYLRNWAAGQIRPQDRALIEPDDLIQEIYTAVFRDIAQFQMNPAEPEQSFLQWLMTLARHRLLDLLKAKRAAKRGGGAVNRAEARSLVVMLEAVARFDHTPSSSVAAHEATAAVRDAIERLTPDYRQALRLRYLQGLSVSATAAQMGRTPRAIHMLCHRGLAQLKQEIGSVSRFFSAG